MRNLEWVIGLAMALGVSGAMGATSVKAELSADEVAMGSPLQLRIEVDGSTNAVAPATIEVDGLSITQRGRSTQVQMNNLQFSTAVVFTYEVVALREGTFEIPAIDVLVDGKTVSTSALTLEAMGGFAPPPRRAIPVVPGQGVQPRGTPPPVNVPPDPAARLAYAEMVIPRESVFVGEMVPVEIRFYFNKNYGFRLLQEQPTFSGEGFTVEDLTAPKRGEQVVGGTAYHVFSFQSAITPVKSGELEIPGVSMPAIVQVPSQAPQGFDDLFSQFFGNSVMADSEQLNVTSDPMKLAVKPLPKDGRPEGFTGAIGDFTMAVDAEPKATAPGDPVTLRVRVNGRGNFSAMGEPKLVGADGWKLYPPTEEFDAADAVGFGGVKTSDFMMIAKAKQTETPGVEFSYFDPTKEAYVTLVGDPIAVVAEAAVATPTPDAGGDAGSAGGAVVAEVGSGSPEVPGRSGVLETATRRTFVPPLRQAGFLVANGLAFAVVLGFAGVFVMRRIRSGVRAQRAAVGRRHSAMIARLRDPALDDGEFLAAAEEDLDVLVSASASDGRRALIRSVGISDDGAAALAGLLAKVDERKFASGAAVSVGPDERRAVVDALVELGGGR
jgi:hypothetical protein